MLVANLSSNKLPRSPDPTSSTRLIVHRLPACFRMDYPSYRNTTESWRPLDGTSAAREAREFTQEKLAEKVRLDPMTRLQQLLDGEWDLEDVIEVGKYVMSVTVHPDGTFTDEDGRCFGSHRTGSRVPLESSVLNLMPPAV